mmetsp:Transcript_42696/g.69215  ORF Transcript_42696/g.69215 Transcript_42696/m.69215 type:complete len:1003 (+) Transcript_42696:157-3165(+)
MVLESLISSILRRYLRFLKNIDIEKLSTLRGDIRISDVDIDGDALEEFLIALNLPVKIIRGFVGNISITFPWMSFQTPIPVVTLDGIYLVCGPQSDTSKCYERSQAEKELLLSTYADTIVQMLQPPADRPFSLPSIVERLIENFILRVSNVYVRFEDGYSNPGKRFAFGFSMKMLEIKNEPLPLKAIFSAIRPRRVKVLNILGLSFYHDSSPGVWVTALNEGTSFTDMKYLLELLADLNDLFKNPRGPAALFLSRQGIMNPSRISQAQYMLQPFSIRGKISFFEGFVIQGVVKIDEPILVRMWKSQFDDLLSLMSFLDAYYRYRKVQNLRPSERPTFRVSARGWWVYAAACLQVDKQISKRPSLFNTVLSAVEREQYCSLYHTAIAKRATKSVLDKIKAMEKDMSMADVLRYRLQVAQEYREAGLSIRKRGTGHVAASGSWKTKRNIANRRATMMTQFSEISVARARTIATPYDPNMFADMGNNNSFPPSAGKNLNVPDINRRYLTPSPTHPSPSSRPSLSPPVPPSPMSSRSATPTPLLQAHTPRGTAASAPSSLNTTTTSKQTGPLTLPDPALNFQLAAKEVTRSNNVVKVHFELHIASVSISLSEYAESSVNFLHTQLLETVVAAELRPNVVKAEISLSDIAVFLPTESSVVNLLGRLEPPEREGDPDEIGKHQPFVSVDVMRVAEVAKLREWDIEIRLCPLRLGLPDAALADLMRFFAREPTRFEAAPWAGYSLMPPIWDSLKMEDHLVKVYLSTIRVEGDLPRGIATNCIIELSGIELAYRNRFFSSLRRYVRSIALVAQQQQDAQAGAAEGRPSTAASGKSADSVSVTVTGALVEEPSIDEDEQMILSAGDWDGRLTPEKAVRELQVQRKYIDRLTSMLAEEHALQLRSRIRNDKDKGLPPRTPQNVLTLDMPDDLRVQLSDAWDEVERVKRQANERMQALISMLDSANDEISVLRASQAEKSWQFTMFSGLPSMLSCLPLRSRSQKATRSQEYHV